MTSLSAMVSDFDRLYKLNNKDADYAPEEGDVLRLR